MLTKEREHDIRFYADQFHHNSSALEDCDAERAIHELLSEVDSLRNELETLKNPSDGRCMEIGALRLHNADLLAENEKFRRDYDKHDLILERDKLRKYIKKIRVIGLDLIVQLKCQKRSLPGEIDTFEDLLREYEKHGG